MSCGCQKREDYGPEPYILDIGQAAAQNRKFRTAVWTGENLQMTLMCIPPCGEIGTEIHSDTDQLIRIEQGCALVMMGCCRDRMDFRKNLRTGDGIFVPAGTWHNVINTGRNRLKVSSVYAPPHHPGGTVHDTKEDAEREEYENQ